MELSLGARGGLPLRPSCARRADLRDRHAAAHGERVAARRSRLLLHAHRHGRALPAHARHGGLLSDGLGRQRPADRASRAEPLRRALRPLRRLRPRVRSDHRLRRRCPRAVRARAGAGVAPELRRALPAADRERRAGVRGAVARARPVGRLVDDVHDDRDARPARLAGLLPRAARARGGLPARGAHPLGRRLPDRGGAGRARGPRAPRGDAQAALRRSGRGGAGADRDDPP